MALKPEDLRFILSADVDLSSLRRGVNNILTELQGPLGPAGLAFGAASGALGTIHNFVKELPVIGGVLGALTAPLVIIPNILKDITTALIGFAAKASPGQFRLWQIALEDVQAVIGRTFLPVLELMRMGVRLFGNVLAEILPNTGEVRGALSELREMFGRMAREIGSLMSTIGPQIREFLIEGLRSLSHWLAVAAQAVGILALRLKTFFEGMRGPGGRTGEAPRGSEGAAARPAQFLGLEEYKKQLQLAAIREPGAMSEDEKMVARLTDIAVTERQALDLANRVEKFFNDTVSWIKSAWLDVSSTAKSVAFVANATARFIKKFIDDSPGTGRIMDESSVRPDRGAPVYGLPGRSDMG